MVSECLSSARVIPPLRAAGEKVLFKVRVSPSATRTALQGVYGDRIKVSVSAPPEDNRANRELAETLARWLDVRRDAVCIEAGHGSRDKVVAVSGLGEGELRARLEGLLYGGCSREGIAG